MALLTLRAPAISAASSAGVMLSLGPKLTTAPVNLATAPSANTVKVIFTIHNKTGTTTSTVNSRTALGIVLQSGTGSFWMQGPLATEARTDTPVVNALHVVMDIRDYADGTSFTDVQINNDIAMSRAGGAVTYDVTIQSGGATVASFKNIFQYQYSSWHYPVWSNGQPQVNVQHDIAYLEGSGAIPPYDLTTGVAASTLAGEVQNMGAGWDAPLSTNGVTTGMGTTGGRPDIGPQPQWIAIWLLTGDARAAAYALGNADSGGSVPWNMWDAAKGHWLNTVDYPDIWTDPRGGPGSYTTGLTQSPPSQSSSQPWFIDTAHQPDLNYVPYILTGDHYRLDRLLAQAAYSVTDTWPTVRQAYGKPSTDDIVAYGLQIRATAWDLREIQEAAWIGADGSFEQTYFNGVMNDNLSYLISLEPSLTTQEGQLAGIWGLGDYSSGIIPPWELDFLASSLGLSAIQGNAKAAQVLGWMDGYLAGRFLPHTGWNQRDGCAYNIVAGNSSNVYYKTWAAVESATAANGSSNGNGWVQSEGYYCQLGIASLGYLGTVVKSAIDAPSLSWIKNAGAPYTDTNSNQLDPTYNLVVRP